jgi:hypothetical protein
MQGRIVSVLETWPLQLTVDAPGGRWSVALSSGTEVTERGRSVDHARLRGGARIAVTGRQTGPLAMIADRIDLLP